MTRYKRPFLATLLVLAAAGSAQCGEILRTSATAEFTWSSTECVRPSKPFFRDNDPMRQQKLSQYAAQTSRYIDCLKREAQRDFDRAQLEMQQAVQDTLQRETDRANDAMEAIVYRSR